MTTATRRLSEGVRVRMVDNFALPESWHHDDRWQDATGVVAAIEPWDVGTPANPEQANVLVRWDNGEETREFPWCVVPIYTPPFDHVEANDRHVAFLVDERGYDRACIKTVHPEPVPDGQSPHQWEIERSQAIYDLIDAAPKLVEALEQVQVALANWRDGRDVALRHPETGRPLHLEEVKYCVVDPILAELRGENDD